MPDLFFLCTNSRLQENAPRTAPQVQRNPRANEKFRTTARKEKCYSALQAV